MRKLFVLCMLLGASLVSALNVSDPSGFVNDFADILPVQEKISLEQELDSFADETSVEIAVVSVSTLSGEDIAMFATELGQKWGIGDAEQDRGVVIVIAPTERQWFVAVGYGLEGVLPDAIVKRMGERYLPDAFAKGDYIGGLRLMIQDMKSYIMADPSVINTYQQDQISQEDDFETAGIVFGVVFLSSLWFSKKHKRRQKFYRTGIWIVGVVVVTLFLGSILSALFVVSILSMLLLGGGLGMFWFPGGGRGFGAGGMGGFGGFGGGGFGGGGAGGRW